MIEQLIASKGWQKVGIRKVSRLFGALLRSLFLAISLFASAAHADNSSSTWDDLSAAIRAPYASLMKKSSQYEFNSSILIDTSRSLNDSDHPTWEQFYKAHFGVTDKKNEIAYGAEAGFAQHLTYQADDGSDGDFVFAVVYVSKFWKNGRDFHNDLIDQVAVTLTGNIPAGQDAGRRTYEGGVGPGVSVAKHLWRFTLGQGFSYSRGFYMYDIRDDGTINNPDIYKSKSSLSFDITEKLSLSALYIYTEAVDFNAMAKGADTTYLEVDYAVSKVIGLAMGVATDRASTLDPEGQTESLKFYDQENAAAYFDVSLSF